MNPFQTIVPPSQIEPELVRIWETLAKANKSRACLFNLIVFQRCSARTDYFRGIVQKVLDTFPCRVLFISHDDDPTKNYLKTAVSIVAPAGEGAVACDHIDIGVAGSEWERVPSVILPHIVPDLPVYLLWTEDPVHSHPLFKPLAHLATRVIFDSESADSLLGFSEALLTLKEQGKLDIADLNWARLEGWRDLLSAIFETKERWADLRDLSEIKIVYNARETEFFCHLKIQAMYLLALFASRLNWKWISSTKEAEGAFRFSFEQAIQARIEPVSWKDLGPAILSLELKTASQKHYVFTRNQQAPHQVAVQISSLERCELPSHFFFGKIAMGQSLVREIFLKGTSSFFLGVLHQLQSIDRERLC